MDVRGSSCWRGSFREGEGTISTRSGTLANAPYTFASRFEGAPGACPEELVAAAHAACFNHALANIFGMSGLALGHVDTAVDLTMGKDERGHPAITAIRFKVAAAAPGVPEADFQRCAEMARDGCAISKALRVPLALDAKLLR